MPGVASAPPLRTESAVAPQHFRQCGRHGAGLSAAYHFAQQSVMAWSVFYMKIDNYIDTSASLERQYNALRDTTPQSWAQQLRGSNGCTADGCCDYSIQRPRNAGDGKVKGFNISF